MTEDTLFELPRTEQRLRSCPVCGGRLSVTHSHTYAMQRQGWVKLGASSNVLERLNVLRRPVSERLNRHPVRMTWSEPLLLLAVIEGDVEHALHERFQDSHARGEWFRPDADMRAWLAELPDPDLAELTRYRVTRR